MNKIYVIIILLLSFFQTVSAIPQDATKSKYFKTKNAGFALIEGKGVRYLIDLSVRKKIRKDMYGTYFFENPLDKMSPLKFDFILKKRDKKLRVLSPLIKTIKNNKLYSAKILLYKDASKTKLVNTHIQNIEFMLPTEIANKKGIKLLTMEDKISQDEMRILGWSIYLDRRLWESPIKQINQEQSVIEYTPKGESIDKWSAILTSYIVYSNIEIERLFNFVLVELKKECPSFKYSTIEKSSNHILMDWSHKGCRGNKPQHELRKFVNTNGFVYSLSISWKESVFTNEIKENWLNKLKLAEPVL